MYLGQTFLCWGHELQLNGFVYFWGRFHEKSQTDPNSRLSQGLKSETFVSAEFLAQMDFTKGGSAETTLKLWSQLFNLISYIFNGLIFSLKSYIS